MPRYFFDVQNDGHPVQDDDDGCDLASDSEAEQEAVEALQQMAKSMIIKDGRSGLKASVRNAAGHTFFKAQLSLTMNRISEGSSSR